MTLTSAEKIQKLRASLADHDLDAVVIPTDDAHSSEYPADCDARRQYISGFSGSAGTAVVTAEEALLWTDGRYFTQADHELDKTIWTLMKDRLPDTPSINAWLKKTPSVSRIGFDPMTTSIAKHLATVEELKDSAVPKSLVSISHNLVDLIWDKDGRPSVPHSQIYVLGDERAGCSTAKKLENVRECLSRESTFGCVFSLLDDVAWLLNLRAADIEFCPVFLAYLFITVDSATLYVDCTRISSEALQHLRDNNIALSPYNKVFDDVKSVHGEPSRRLWLDGMSCLKLRSCVVEPEKSVLVKQSPVQLPKAKKNDVEIAGMKEAHVKDALAEITYLSWLENLSDAELISHTEFTVGSKLDGLRESMMNSKGLSFATISSIGPNGAVIHYRPHADTALRMSRDLYLVDSGGQYMEGTTDVTRTLHLGTPTAFQSEVWTRVFKGHLRLNRVVFPKGTTGAQLDVLARQDVWEAGLNYLHGTGHGVGMLLNVHEGPQRISPDFDSKKTILEPGMVISNEPGYYLEDQFGVRIENLFFVKLAAKMNPNQIGDFYNFEDLTLIPYQKKMMCLDLLTNQEIEQINNYHKRVWDVLSVRLPQTALPDQERTLKWLEAATSPVARPAA